MRNIGMATVAHAGDGGGGGPPGGDSLPRLDLGGREGEEEEEDRENPLDVRDCKRCGRKSAYVEKDGA